jgi:hypothetical protein
MNRWTEGFEVMSDQLDRAQVAPPLVRGTGGGVAE